jgi:predicted DCC family thiol-disulfide oxidoreductase YuxK
MKDIIFFDGECGYCNSFINFVVTKDQQHFLIADRKSSLFLQIVTKFKIKEKNNESIYVLVSDTLLEKANAIAHILRQCGIRGKILAILISFFPASLSNHVYDFISMHRKKFNKVSCKVPDESFKSRLIQ